MKLKRSILSVLVALATTSLVYAAPITPDQALNRLAGESIKRRVVSIGEARPSLAHTVSTQSGSPAAYIFTRQGQDGYFVLSADDTATPLLGYSDSGSFDEGQMPEAMRWWLSEYARQMEYANSIGTQAYTDSKKRAVREAIEPMVKTKWNQMAPYNNVCPLAGYTRTFTGCVATAMAQVMNYWKYPGQGQGSITYAAHSINKQLTMSFAKLVIDWDNMLDEYIEGCYGDAEADAVAKLMRACGYSVKMDYSTVASSAYTLDISGALVKYFDYDPNIRFEIRDLYSAEQWEDMIYDNLKNVGPVPYGGFSSVGYGHSFVCDGYDGNGYFHFNWGWGGMSDGYFLLDALNPELLGVGGGTEGDYNSQQDAVLGIQPPTGNPVVAPMVEVIQYGTLTGAVDGTELVFGLTDDKLAYWVNYTDKTLNITFGAIFEPVDGTEGETFIVPVTSNKITLKSGYATPKQFLPAIDLAKLSLVDGTYKVTFAANIDEETRAEWMPVHATFGHCNYIFLNKHNDNYNTSGIRLVQGDGTENAAHIYSAQGVNLGNCWQSLPAGLYIRNGKKLTKK